jgi:hypothetical protein
MILFIDSLLTSNAKTIPKWFVKSVNAFCWCENQIDYIINWYRNYFHPHDFLVNIGLDLRTVTSFCLEDLFLQFHSALRIVKMNIS